MPLRIATGWAVCYNRFFDFPPHRPPTSSEYLYYFSRDLLRLRSGTHIGEEWRVDPAGFLLDLGWYPDCDPAGAYRLVVVTPDLGGRTVVDTAHRDPAVIRDVIEACTALLTVGAPLPALVQRVRHIVDRSQSVPPAHRRRAIAADPAPRGPLLWA